MTRHWRVAPDANYERRVRFVEDALAILSKTAPIAA